MPPLTWLSLLIFLFLSACKDSPLPPPAAPVDAPAQAAQPEADAPGKEAFQEYRTPEQIKADSRQYGHIPISGRTTPEAVLTRFDSWRTRAAEARANPQTAQALGAVAPGAKVTVLFGTWCKDCFRELPQLWKAFELAGGQDALPFDLEYIALDETFVAQDVDLSPYDIKALPTIIVTRQGQEVGRMVESSMLPVEDTLLALLTGEKQGTLPGAPVDAK